MLATRVLFFVITALVWGLNGWALLQLSDILPRTPDAIYGALVANLILVPLVMWGSYRTGELAEEAFRANAAAATARATAASTRPPAPNPNDAEPAAPQPDPAAPISPPPPGKDHL